MPTFRLYCRRSKKEKLLQKFSQSIEHQVERCLTCVHTELHPKWPRIDLPGADEVYIDDGVSGKVKLHKRPAGSQLLDDLKRGDVIVMTAWDRGFRRMLDYLQSLEDWGKSGQTIWVVSAPYDLTTRVGRMGAKLSALIAEEEWELSRERALDAQAIRKKHGMAIGQAPYGYKNEGPEKYRRTVPDHAERAVIEQMAELRSLGFTFEQIVQWFWSQALLTKDKVEQRKYLMPRTHKPPGSPYTVWRALEARDAGYPLYGQKYEDLLSGAVSDIRDLYEDKSLAIIEKMGYDAASREVAGYVKPKVKDRKNRCSNRSLS